MSSLHAFREDALAQVEILKKCQEGQRKFAGQIADARKRILDLEGTVTQAKDNLAHANSTAQQEALMDDTLTNDTKRKAAVELALTNSAEVKFAKGQLRDAERQLALAKIDLEKITDQRRAVEFAQTAAGHILNTYNQEGIANVASTRQQPTTHHTNGR